MRLIPEARQHGIPDIATVTTRIRASKASFSHGRLAGSVNGSVMEAFLR
jgi:hypothetical protein